jgi:putative transposase
VARGWRFEVETTTPTQRALIARHFGARRFAYNWAQAQVKANLDARAADPLVPPLGWSLPTLRKAWNQAKAEVAPWWPSCSKEAYASGITDLVAALHSWSASKQGRRAGARVGFPWFKSRHHDRGRVRFTTGATRLEPDRRHLTLPAIGKLRCGIDLGIGAEWAVIAHADDTIERIAHPAPWAAAQQQRRRLARCLSRRVVGSRGHPQARAKLAALDRRAANLRRESIHALTTALARRYGTIVVEDLDVSAMGRAMGRRTFRRGVYQAGLGRVRPTLAYKTSWNVGRVVVADGWFASSKSHHGCGGYLADLSLGQRVWVCPACRRLVDRNANAALNLRDWTGPVADRDVQRGGVATPVPLVGDHDGQALAPGRTDPRSRGRGTPNRGTRR